MGADQSRLTPEDIDELESISYFSAKEIKSLFHRFQKLDRNGSGVLTSNDFQFIPELSMNPLCHRIIAVLDEAGNEQVNFKMFVKAMSIFTGKAKEEEKVKFAFKIFDVDGDNVISNEDLFHVLKLMCGNNISDEQLQVIVDSTIKDSTDGKNVIKLADFDKIFNKDDFVGQMTMKFY